MLYIREFELWICLDSRGNLQGCFFIKNKAASSKQKDGARAAAQLRWYNCFEFEAYARNIHEIVGPRTCASVHRVHPRSIPYGLLGGELSTEHESQSYKHMYTCAHVHWHQLDVPLLL